MYVQITPKIEEQESNPLHVSPTVPATTILANVILLVYIDHGIVSTMLGVIVGFMFNRPGMNCILLIKNSDMLSVPGRRIEDAINQKKCGTG